MKYFTMKMMIATMLMALFSLTACAEKNHMGTDTMEKSPMKKEMNEKTKMMKMDTTTEMSKKVEGDMKKKMDTMDDGMGKAMNDEMKKSE
ncbi:MAG: hypothetical protein GY705_20025 [Bacteroidetes bacterium]|nr:hypothetical protein [Bacteroidota bacterium]